MKRVVSNDVWRQLDPHAGRLSRRGALRVWVIVAACLALLIASLAAKGSGVIRPQLHLSNIGLNTSRPAVPSPASPAHVTETIYLRNSGWSAITVTGIGGSFPGAEQTAVRPIPVTIGPGKEVTVVLSYTITSCIGPMHLAPLPIRTQRFWGTQRVSAVNDDGNDWLTDVLQMACGP